GTQDVAARLLDDIDDPAHAPRPGNQQTAAAGGAVDGVERALLVVARGTFTSHDHRVVVDDGSAGVADGGGVGPESTDHDDGREGSGAARQRDAGREASAAPVLGHVHGDVG